MELTKERKNQVDMLIRFFNLKAGTHCWIDPNVSAVNEAIEAADGDLGQVKAWFGSEIANGRKNIKMVCGAFVADRKARARVQEPRVQEPIEIEVEAVTVDAPAELKVDAAAEWKKVEASAPADGLTASLDFMSKLVAEMLAKTKIEEIKDAVGGALRDDVKQFISENYGPIKRKVEIELPERKVELEGVIHHKFDKVLKFVQVNEPVFLTGPAGSGKNVLCQQVAKTLGLDFYFSNAVTHEYKITGFTDAMGVFHESQFFKAFKNGGLFMLDEMDASIPEVLIILNAAIANRYFDFPAPIGYVEAHPNFRVIAAGNTFGHGADYDYVGRNQLDAASLDRFAMVRIDYDMRIEEGCANGDMDLVNFCRKFRAATNKAGIRTVVSYRAISRMAKLSSLMDTADLLDSCLIKSLDVDDLNAIKSDVEGCGKYTDAFNKIIRRRKSGN